MKFSLIHPTRSRPEKSMATINKWLQRSTGDVEVIISLDDDDPSMSSYVDFYSQRFRTIINKNKSSVEAVNIGAFYATGDVMIVVSDDTDCPKSWGLVLTDALIGKKDFVLKVNDGIQKHICTMPIFDRAYYLRDKRVYNPIFLHSFCDTEYTEVARLRGRLIVRNDIKFPHNHYSVTGEKPDELYIRNDATHDPGRKIFQERQRINFGL